MKLVVLAGGPSSERLVSMATGTAICRSLRSRGHRAVFVDLTMGLDTVTEDIFDRPDGNCPNSHIGSVEEDREHVLSRRKEQGKSVFGPHVLEVCQMADMVFMGLHGACGEDGRIQAMFDLLGIRYTGSDYCSSAMAMNKIVSKQIMDANQINTPHWKQLTYTENEIEIVATDITLPCVVKTASGGSSLGVYIAEDQETLVAALKDVLQFGDRVIIEEKIVGREIEIGVLGDRALPAVEIIPKAGYFDYRSKYQKGAATEICPANLTEETAEQLGEIAMKFHRALGMSVYSRIDFILDRDNRAWCLECNSLPGMTPTSLLPQEAAAAGLDYGELCEEIIRLSYQEKRSVLG